jgi:membrane-associated protease RseP (regulator of RpoE activity)
VVLLFFVFLTSSLHINGVYALSIPGGAAYNASFNGSIVKINGNAINSRDALASELSKYKPGDTITVTAAENTGILPAMYPENFFLPTQVAIIGNGTHDYQITLADNNGRAYMGVGVIAKAGTVSIDPNAYFIAATLLLWMFLFSFGIGVVNMLPIGPLDGGQLFGELVGGRKRIIQYVSAIMVALLVFNLIGPLFLS